MSYCTCGVLQKVSVDIKVCSSFSLAGAKRENKGEDEEILKVFTSKVRYVLLKINLFSILDNAGDSVTLLCLM